MITQIRNNKQLKDYCHDVIEDAGVSVTVDSSLGMDDYVGIKVDEYYQNNTKGDNCPKAVDFIVPVDCVNNAYVLYILELKGGKNKNYTTENIYEKFDTAINDFVKNRFKNIFYADKYKYKEIFLYLVSEYPPEAMKYGNYGEYQRIREKLKTKDTLYRDAEFSRPYEMRGKLYRIKREIPPNPIICRK